MTTCFTRDVAKQFDGLTVRCAGGDAHVVELRRELAYRRESLGLSYAALAAAVDRPVSTIHGWLSGTHSPYLRDRATFERVLSVLGVVDPKQFFDVLVLGGPRSSAHPPLGHADLIERLERLERRLALLEAERGDARTRVGGSPGLAEVRHVIAGDRGSIS